LAPGEYLVAAEPIRSFSSGVPTQTEIYATTFYPSTISAQQAIRVSAVRVGAPPIQIDLIPVSGVRVSGSVTSASGRPTRGMTVRVFHQFGSFGSGANVGVVGADGTFEILHVPPGRYSLTVGTGPSETSPDSEFAKKTVDVQDGDLELSFVAGPGASISGRLVSEPAAAIPAAAGRRVNASPLPEQALGERAVTALVGYDGSFRMMGLSGSYKFTVGADRAPSIMATRVSVDGVERPASSGIEFANGTHNVVIYVALREPPGPAAGAPASTTSLLAQFRSENVFWLPPRHAARRFGVAGQSV
jgi:hypothetical protein